MFQLLSLPKLTKQGVFQTIYVKQILPTYPNSTISWIGSIQAWFLMFFGGLSGRLFDAGYVFPMLLTASILLVFSTFMVSISSQYYQFLLAQGFACGIALGTMFTPAVAAVSTWFLPPLFYNSRLIMNRFRRKRAMALGISAAGSSIGAIVYPIMIQKLNESIGFPWAVRVAAFVQIVTLSVSVLTVRRRIPASGKSPWIELSAFKEPPFTLFTFGVFFGFFGLYFPFYYLPQWVIKYLGTSEDFSIYMLATLNGASTFGRLLPNVSAKLPLREANFQSSWLITLAQSICSLHASSCREYSSFAGLQSRT